MASSVSPPGRWPRWYVFPRMIWHSSGDDFTSVGVKPLMEPCVPTAITHGHTIQATTGKHQNTQIDGAQTAGGQPRHKMPRGFTARLQRPALTIEPWRHRVPGMKTGVSTIPCGSCRRRDNDSQRGRKGGRSRHAHHRHKSHARGRHVTPRAGYRASGHCCSGTSNTVALARPHTATRVNDSAGPHVTREPTGAAMHDLQRCLQRNEGGSSADFQASSIYIDTVPLTATL